jgi:hypothetical protein
MARTRAAMGQGSRARVATEWLWTRRHRLPIRGPVPARDGRMYAGGAAAATFLIGVARQNATCSARLHKSEPTNWQSYWTARNAIRLPAGPSIMTSKAASTGARRWRTIARGPAGPPSRNNSAAVRVDLASCRGRSGKDVLLGSGHIGILYMTGRFTPLHCSLD